MQFRTHTINPECDEVRLSKNLSEAYRDKFKFTETTENSMGDVDVATTNNAFVLNNSTLNEFTTVPPYSHLVVNSEICNNGAVLSSQKHCLLILAGGLSFRSGGKVQPLMHVQDHTSNKTTTLLQLKLALLRNSPLRNVKTFIVGTPFNIDALKNELTRISKSTEVIAFAGGLAPRLSTRQRIKGAITPFKDKKGKIQYNPIGHFEAIRWLVLTGHLGRIAQYDCDIATVMNYSNWGKVFSEETRAIAELFRCKAHQNGNLLFLAEVMKIPQAKLSGSILVTHHQTPDTLRLIKANYGSGNIKMSTDQDLLMSTATLHFSIPGLLHRLAKSAEKIYNSKVGIVDILNNAKDYQDRLELNRIFNEAFPIGTQLIKTKTLEGEEFLRIERDLDQFSFAPGNSPIMAIQVEHKRGVFAKQLDDFNDENIRKFIDIDPVL